MLVAILPFVAIAEQGMPAMSASDLKIVKIAARDERAVVRAPDGSLRVIKVGDTIGTQAKVMAIASGRVVIQEITPRGTETVIIRFDNGEQRVERISKMRVQQQPLYAPQPVTPSMIGN
jgi:hypothetical protein